MKEFTDGKWIIAGNYIVDKSMHVLATVDKINQPWQANLRLISNAPTMYEYLLECCKEIDALDTPPETLLNCRKNIDALISIIDGAPKE